MPRGFRSCVPFRKPLGRHRRRLRQITAPLIPAFQSLTSAAARENPRNRGSVAKVGLAAGHQLPPDSRYCGNIRNLWPTNSGIDGSNGGERALSHSFSATRQPSCTSLEQEEPGGEHKLDLGFVTHRPDHSNPHNRCCQFSLKSRLLTSRALGYAGYWRGGIFLEE